MNSFKIEKEEKTTISIRIGINMLYSLDKLSTANNMSRNQVIIQCIEYALSRYHNIIEKN